MKLFCQMSSKSIKRIVLSWWSIDSVTPSTNWFRNFSFPSMGIGFRRLFSKSVTAASASDFLIVFSAITFSTRIGSITAFICKRLYGFKSSTVCNVQPIFESHSVTFASTGIFSCNVGIIVYFRKNNDTFSLYLIFLLLLLAGNYFLPIQLKSQY